MLQHCVKVLSCSGAPCVLTSLTESYCAASGSSNAHPPALSGAFPPPTEPPPPPSALRASLLCPSPNPQPLIWRQLYCSGSG